MLARLAHLGTRQPLRGTALGGAAGTSQLTLRRWWGKGFPSASSIREQVLQRRDALASTVEGARDPAAWATLPATIRPYADDIALYLRTWLKKYPEGASLRKLQRDVAFRMPIVATRALRQTADGTTERPPKIDKGDLEKLVDLLQRRDGFIIMTRTTTVSVAPDGTELERVKIKIRPPEWQSPAEKAIAAASAKREGEESLSAPKEG